LDEDNEVYVIAPLDEYISYKERYPKVKHIPLKRLSRKNTNPLKDISLIFELAKIYKRLKPDVVLHYTHKANIYGGMAAKISGVKSIAVVTGLGYAFLRKGWISRVTQGLYALVKNTHRKIIFENEDDRDLFVANNLADKEKAIAIKGCGVDTAIYLPSPNNTDEEKTVFTFIGRLLNDKGIREFVKAAELIKGEFSKLEFWVVGELDSGNPSMIKKSVLLEWIEKGHIIYYGFLKDVRPIIAQSDCIVLPSYREGMPRIILEGMSMSKPVITSNVAGCRETVDEGINGFLVEVQNVDSLAEGIKKFLRLSEEEKRIMGEKGRDKALREFNSEKISIELYEIISQVYFCAK
jgi:glycosyltransferase involved in cell wall biosynthesis